MSSSSGSGSCNTPFPPTPPLPATEPAATAFPVLQAGGGLPPPPPPLPGPGSWRGSQGNMQSKALRDPRRIPLQGSWGSHTSGFKQAAARALEKHCPSSRILPFHRKWAPKKSCLETLPHESSPGCRVIPPTQIPFGHFLLSLLSNVPFLQFPALVLDVSELGLDAGEGPWTSKIPSASEFWLLELPITQCQPVLIKCRD